MKRSLLALSLLAVLAVSACNSNAGTWTPMSGGRTAGEGTVETTHKAETAVSHSLRK
jgi:hypothetical protein